MRSVARLLRSVGLLLRSAGHLVRSVGHLVRSAGLLVHSAGHLVRSAGLLLRSAGHLVRSAGHYRRSAKPLSTLCEATIDALRSHYRRSANGASPLSPTLSPVGEREEGGQLICTVHVHAPDAPHSARLPSRQDSGEQHDVPPSEQLCPAPTQLAAWQLPN